MNTKRVCVFGNYSGRNAGDNALLECLMEDVSSVCPDVEYWIPTISPSFIAETYGRFHVRPVSLLPWRGSIKILGVPTLRAAVRADLILVTDAILFDRGFWNPLHNYLHTLSWILPYASRRGVPVVLYNAHLGPVTRPIGRRALRRLLDAACLIVPRDRDSLETIGSLDFPVDAVAVGADCALNITPCDAARRDQIVADSGVFASDRPAVGCSLSTYLKAYPGREPVGAAAFAAAAGRLIDAIVDELDAAVVLISTQLMDLRMARTVMAVVRHTDRVALFSNRTYRHNELAGVITRLDLHVSMRTHPMIFSAAMGVPVVSINAHPKNLAFLESIGQGHRTIDLHEVLGHRDALEKVLAAWRDRAAIRGELAAIMPAQKAAARRTASMLRPYLMGEAARTP